MTILIVALAALLRLIYLNQSLWLDESLEGLALMGKMGHILDYAITDFQPPLYHFIGIAWTYIAGYSEVALRFPSVLAGIGAVIYAMRIGKLVGGRTVAYNAGLLVATNPLLVYYSQEGRTYAMTAFFVTASFAYLLEWLADKNVKSTVKWGYFFMTVGSLWTSYLAWFVVGLQGLYVLGKKRYDIFRALLLGGLTLGAWLPLFVRSLALGHQTALNFPEWGNVVGGSSLKAIALTWVKLVIGRISFDNKALYGSIVGVMALVHGTVLYRVRQEKGLIPLWLWSGGTVVVTALFSLLLPVYSYTRVLFIVPAYLVIMAVGLVKSPKVVTSIIIAANLLFLGIFWSTPRFHREDWRAVVRQFGTDAIYALPSRNQMAPLLYYGVDRSMVREPKTEVGKPVSKIIYIKYVENVFDLDGHGPAALRAAGYTGTASYTYPGLQVDIYENSH